MSNNEPTGWRLVPVKLTPEMRSAFHGVTDSESLVFGNAGSRWRAMLSAAPQPPAAQQGEAVAPADLRERIAAAKEAVDDGDASGCAAILRETLRVLDAKPAAAPQPVAHRALCPHEAAVNDWRLHNNGATETQTVAQGDALRAAPAGVVGEPVATVRTIQAGGNAGLSWRGVPTDGAPILPDGTSLYTAPPARQALTDEQIVKAQGDCFNWLVKHTNYTGGMGGETWDQESGRAVMRACAAAWGVTLVGIGGKGGAA